MNEQFIYRLIIISVITLCSIFTSALAQSPDVSWTRSYGGASYDYGFSVKQTTDGGFVIAGSTESNGAGGKDVWLIRTDSSGNVLWTKTFGGSDLDEGSSVWQNTDGGFIITGQTRSFTADSVDILLIRTDPSGNLIWIKNYGGSGLQIGKSVQQTLNGGFIVAGFTKIDSLNHSNAILLNVNDVGNNPQFFEYDRGDYDYAYSVIQTTTGGYAFCGRTALANIEYDAWLVCTDGIGNILCDKTYGGSESEYGDALIQTYDGGFAIGGTTNSFGTNGSADFWLIRTDASGDTLWTKSFGGVDSELGTSVCQTYDNGFILTGYTNSFSFSGSRDLWLVRTDSQGDTLWTKSVGGNENEIGYSVQATLDSEYIVTGYTTSDGAADVFLVRINSESTIPTYLEYGFMLPSDYILDQNYPNPFNPSTKISWQSPISSWQTLKVFDVLGNEVATLVNEYKDAGSYEVNFDADDQASGIYFYQLKVGEFIETKKLTLVK